MPPMKEIHGLAEELIKELLEVTAKAGADTHDLYVTLDNMTLDQLDRYGHPVALKMMEVFQRHEELFNGWSEAFTMVKLEIRHRMIAENNKTLLGKVINLLNT